MENEKVLFLPANSSVEGKVAIGMVINYFQNLRVKIIFQDLTSKEYQFKTLEIINSIGKDGMIIEFNQKKKNIFTINVVGLVDEHYLEQYMKRMMK